MAKATGLNTPNLDGASKGNFALRTTLQNLIQNISQLQQKTGLTGYDSQKQVPVNQAPSKATGSIFSPGKGAITLTIRNPEYANPKLNPLRTPVIHQVDYSPSSNFIGKKVSLPESTQNTYPLALTGTFWMRFRSSYDGVNWNDFTVVGPVSA